MAKISKRSVDALSSVGSVPAYLWDESLPGFGVKTLASGKKRYLIKYRTQEGRQRWHTLGTHGQLTPDQARKLAQQALAAVARGEDPQEERSAARIKKHLRDLWQIFESDHLSSLKPATRRDYRYNWDRAIAPALGNLETKAIRRGDAERLHKKWRNTPYRANRILALLSRLMTLAEVMELRPQGTNPCRYVERFKEEARTRFLNDQELTRLGAALNDLCSLGTISLSAANAIRLLLLTGARRNEVLQSRWSWLDTQRRIIALPDSKTGAKPLYLSTAALEVLEGQRGANAESEFIFPYSKDPKRTLNIDRAWDHIRSCAELADVRLHDLRHTAASVAAGSGVSLPVIGRLLGHSQMQTTQRYAHIGNDPALGAANIIAEAVAERIALL